MQIGPTHDPADLLRPDCPGSAVFETVTNRWSLLILRSLRGRPQRFFQVRDQLDGISERVLSQNLKALTRSGIIARHVEASVPPQVSYSLTAIGGELLAVMDGLTGWIAASLPVIAEAEGRHDKT